MKSVGIVLVNFNGYEMTRKCIQSLFLCDYAYKTVIVVDNGSTDGSGQRLRDEYGEKIVFLDLGTNGGVTAGNNAGIRCCIQNGLDYTLFLNNDTEVEPDFLSHLIADAKDQARTLFVPKIKLDQERERLDFWNGRKYSWIKNKPVGYRAFPHDSALYDREYDFSVTSTCALLVPTALFERIGLMDEGYFMYYDDADFTLRAKSAGFTIRFVPGSVVYHKSGMSSGQGRGTSFFQMYLLNRNVFYFYRKNCPNKIISALFVRFWKTRLQLNTFISIVKKQKQKAKVLSLVLQAIKTRESGEPTLYYSANR